MLVFYLPPESGEKVNMGVTVLLALTVFLLLVAESMPPQSKNIPLAGKCPNKLHSSFSETHNNGIDTNFIFPYICSFVYHNNLRMLLNVKLDVIW